MSDLISRENAIKNIRLMDVCVIYDDMCSTEEAVEKAIVATKRNAIFGLDCMLSAEPDKDLIHLQKEQAYMQGYEDGRKSRKKGKWIEKDDCWDGIYYECSVCKYSFSSTEGTPSDNDYYFCPNCGCQMSVGEQE